MSSNNTTFNGNNQKQQTITREKIFLFGLELKKYNCIQYGADTLAIGTVMGVVAATGHVRPCRSDSTDGSQYPIGVLAGDYTIEDSEDKEVSVAIRGDLRADLLVFENTADSLTTIINSIKRRLGDILEDRFILRQVTNATRYDNTIS